MRALRAGFEEEGVPLAVERARGHEPRARPRRRRRARCSASASASTRDGACAVLAAAPGRALPAGAARPTCARSRRTPHGSRGAARCGGAPRPERLRSRRLRAGSGRCPRSGHGRARCRAAPARCRARNTSERRHPHPLHERRVDAAASVVRYLTSRNVGDGHATVARIGATHVVQPVLPVLRRRGEVPDDRHRDERHDAQDPDVAHHRHPGAEVEERAERRSSCRAGTRP